MSTEEITVCGYCGRETTEPTGLHAQLYGVLSEFAEMHQHQRTWQHCHEWAARIEALVRTGVDPWPTGHDAKYCVCDACSAVVPFRRSHLKVAL